MDLSKLQKLKNMMLTAEEFGEPWKYFLDQFGEDQAFFDLGRPPEDDGLLRAILTRTGKELFGRDATLSHVHLVEIKKYNFIHGTYLIQGRLGSVIYFSDIGVGIAALLGKTLSAETLFVRFMTVEVPKEAGKPPEVMIVPPASKRKQ